MMIGTLNYISIQLVFHSRSYQQAFSGGFGSLDFPAHILLMNLLGLWNEHALEVE
jgi:hypothetical protein